MILVVTGGIGSGKSLVCRMLTEQYGIPVYEADNRVKALYAEVPSILDDIEAALEVSLRNEEGVFVPRILADVIFSDPMALAKVEDIVFPQLKNDFASWSDSQGKAVVAFESATVLEKSQFDGFGDIVLLVDAPISVRLSRACERDGVDLGRVIERMMAQKLMNSLSDGAVDSRIDYTILNDSSEENLSQKLNEFIEKYELTKML